MKSIFCVLVFVGACSLQASGKQLDPELVTTDGSETSAVRTDAVRTDALTVKLLYWYFDFNPSENFPIKTVYSMYNNTSENIDVTFTNQQTLFEGVYTSTFSTQRFNILPHTYTNGGGIFIPLGPDNKNFFIPTTFGTRLKVSPNGNYSPMMTIDVSAPCEVLSIPDDQMDSAFFAPDGRGCMCNNTFGAYLRLLKPGIGVTYFSCEP